jgi:hypothetical protein
MTRAAAGRVLPDDAGDGIFVAQHLAHRLKRRHLPGAQRQGDDRSVVAGRWPRDSDPHGVVQAVRRSMR